VFVSGSNLCEPRGHLLLYRAELLLERIHAARYSLTRPSTRAVASQKKFPTMSGPAPCGISGRRWVGNGPYHMQSPRSTA
jgi:hypothetical protein